MKNSTINHLGVLMGTLLISGVFCLPVPARADCTNGIQDGDEEGIDCGGSCSFSCPTNWKSGISLVFQGTPGKDYAEEYFYYDKLFDDHKVVYLKANMPILMMHNERNVISDNKTCSGGSRIIGTNGPDGIANSGDEGQIIFKVDRDSAYYNYKSYQGNAFIPYVQPFSFAQLEFEPGFSVVGGVGPSGPRSGDYYRGITDKYSDEWHILTYWDNDAYYSCLDGRASLSDAKIVSFVVNPKTPLISFKALTSSAQFYTTPPKTYFVPVIHDQTTYLTNDIQITLVNIMTADPIWYRVNQGNWLQYAGPLLSQNIFSNNDTEYSFAYVYQAANPNAGITGIVKERRIRYNPAYPSDQDVYPDGSKHGYLLWKNDAELDYIRQKFTREPYATAFYHWRSDGWIGLNTNDPNKYPLAVRPIWRGWPGVAGDALGRIAYFLFVNTHPEDYALTAKKALLDLFVVDPVGGELGGYETYAPAGSPDRLDIPNSGVLPYVNAGIAYDLLISNFKASSGHAQGVTPIEDYKIRDNLASQAFVMMLSKIQNGGGDGLGPWGSGNMHYSLGYEQIISSLGIAMPAYNTDYYGTSGFDFLTQARQAWTPYPDQALTWHEVITDPNVATPGKPDLDSFSRYFTNYKPFTQLLNAVPDNAVLPATGQFWVAANAFTCCKGMYPEGTSASAMNSHGCVPAAYDFDCSTLGLDKVNTISGTFCQKDGWNRSFNMPPSGGDSGCCSPGDKLFHVENAGYESPFAPYTIVLNNIYKKKYGVPITETVEKYLRTKIDRIAGNFDPNYLKQYGQSDACHDYINGQHVLYDMNNSQWLACEETLALYNPINPAAKGIVHYPQEFMTRYHYYGPKKLEPSILAMIFYEDDMSKYVSYGDISGDNEVTAYDAALVAQASVGLITLTADQTKAADVSGDSEITAYDAALIAQRAVGLIDKFPVEP